MEAGVGPGGQRGPGARGARSMADYMLLTRDLETSSSAAAVCSLYAGNFADKNRLKIVEARRLTTSIPHATWKQPHSPQMCF